MSIEWWKTRLQRACLAEAVFKCDVRLFQFLVHARCSSSYTQKPTPADICAKTFEKRLATTQYIHPYTSRNNRHDKPASSPAVTCRIAQAEERTTSTKRSTKSSRWLAER